MDLTLEEVQAYLEDQWWTFAKSYPTAPHWYIVRAGSRHPEQFSGVVEFIRRYGKKEKFWKATYVYLYLDGYKYWTMGAPVEETTIINRAEVE